MTRQTGWKSPRSWCPEGLEPRSLPAGAAAGLVDVLRELGPVSGPAAAAGLAATANIPAGTAVTFRFEVEAAGDYKLLVRHDGDGLGLVAATPSASASLDPGPAGYSSTLSLHLDAVAYEVTASAGGKGAVFVDWELLLTSGVGQSAAVSTRSAASPPVPPASSSSTLAPAPAPATPGGFGASTAPGSVSAPAAFLIAGPVGRPSFGPSARLAVPEAPAPGGPAGRGAVPEQIAEVPVPAPVAPVPAMLAQGAAIAGDELALAGPTWWGGPSGSPTAGPSDVAGVAAVEVASNGAELEPGARLSLAGGPPEIIIGAILVGVAARKHLARSRKARDRARFQEVGNSWMPDSAAGKWRVDRRETPD